MRCPTPHLKGYPDKAGATDELTRRYRNPPKAVKPYECDCGAWHLTPRQRGSRGEGRPYKRANGLWVCAVTVPGPIPGKQQRKTVSAKDRATALARRKKLLEDVAKGNITRSPKLTVAQWLDHWLEKIHKPNVKPKTYRYYESGIRLLIKPHIGNKQLAKLTPEDIRDLIKVIQRTSTRNAVKAHQILQTALKGAIREGVLERNVVTVIKKPNHVTAEIPPFTTDQAKHIMRTAIDLSDPLADRWSFAFLSVARPSELNGLEWSRVDFDNKVLDLSWQLQELTSKRHGCGEPDEAGAYPCGRKRAGWCPDAEFDFEPGFEYRPCHGTQVWTRPKTAKGKRPLPLIEPLEAMLRLRLKRQKPGPLDLVWAHDDGRPYGPTELNERWHALMVAAGLETEVVAVETDESDAECNEIESVSGDPESPDLPGRVLYAARHTAATLLMELGVPEDVRMAIMGQSSVVAHRGYVHVDQTQMKAALSKLNELVNPALH